MLPPPCSVVEVMCLVSGEPWCCWYLSPLGRPRFTNISTCAAIGPEQANSVSVKSVTTHNCTFLVCSSSVLQEICIYQLNRGFLKLKQSAKRQVSADHALIFLYFVPGKQTHLGKLSVSMLPCNFFVFVSWKKLLRGKITVAEHLVKQTEFPSLLGFLCWT